MTAQRQVILDEVKRDPGHPTADEIYERVRKRIPRVSLGTVYRNLDTLVSCGFVEKLDPGRPQMRFDGNTDDHYHLTCVRCGMIEDIPMKPTDNSFEKLQNALGNLTMHGIFAHKLEFVGLCAKCLAEGHTFPEGLEDRSSQ